MKTEKRVWVLSLEGAGDIQGASLSLAAQAAGLAQQLDAALEVILVGEKKADYLRRLACCGAQRVLLLPPCDEYQASRQIARLARSYHPEIILGASTVVGRSVAAQTAALLKTGLTADCTQLSITRDGLLLQSRPAFGGSLLASIICPTARPQMATVRPKEPPAGLTDLRLPEILEVDGEPCVSPLTVLERTAVSGQAAVRDADVIVAGGRGIGSRRGFQKLELLARRLGGITAGSRAAVDAQYIGYSRQIGQTGSIVAPKLYLAFGISGAVQHTVGMNRSKFVIAVNSDPQAPIFDWADLGVVDDWENAVDTMLSRLDAGEAGI